MWAALASGGGTTLGSGAGGGGGRGGCALIFVWRADGGMAGALPARATSWTVGESGVALGFRVSS